MAVRTRGAKSKEEKIEKGQQEAAAKPGGKSSQGRRRKRDIVKAKIDKIDTHLKTMPMQKFASISAILHFACLVAAGHGIIYADYALGLDRILIACGFLAYSFDVGTAVLLGRSYFYRWTRMDVFIHHIPFMFVGGLYAMKTFHILDSNSNIASIDDFQQAIRWAMLSCSNECSLAVGGALDLANHRSIRLTSTVAGLVYFLICSPVWFFYALRAVYVCDTRPVVLLVNAAIPMLYAATQYPLFVKVYWKRLMKLKDQW
mmetsp:Transcript_9496/g.19362  ORF Transcript_9496/g.19362 Transcript_9496/m.19362 type:complete len:259 (+) Transcript_9496:74-850(+)